MIARALLLATALIAASSAFATGANPNAIVKLDQPDGRSFLARIWGDEFIHGYEALNGHTVALHGRTVPPVDTLDRVCPNSP